MDPEEFEKVDSLSPSNSCVVIAKKDLEVLSEVKSDSPTSFAMIERRQKAKHRAMQLLPQFKQSIISAFLFKPNLMTVGKFCIVDWKSFTTRFYEGELFVWVENDRKAKHSVAIITGEGSQPYANYIPVSEMNSHGLNQSKTFENLNLRKDAPQCPFILWCNGKYWEILGKLSNTAKVGLLTLKEA
jgi:hypothetical protein